MDSQSQDLQVLNVFGVLRESFKVLFCSRLKLFASLVLTLTLPLCLIILAHNLAIDPLESKINRNEALDIHKDLTSERILLGFLLAAYVLFVLLFALLSTAAIVYTVACLYTNRGVTYAKVIRVVPKVWKRLLVTFLWAFLFVFFLIGGFLAAMLFIFIVFYPLSSTLADVFWWILSVLFLAVLFHFTCIFNLGSVISVLEESYGLGALRRGSQFMKGRRLVAYVLYAFNLVLSGAVVIGFDFLTDGGSHSTGLALRIFLGIIFALVLSFVDLLGIVIFTILYFSCKAYHHESIDRLALSEHLGAYAGEYVNLRASVQMEAMQQA